MADPHLLEGLSVEGTLDPEIILPAAEPIPEDIDGNRDLHRRPIREAVVCHDASEMSESLVFILCRGLQPVFAIEIQDDAALIEAMAGCLEGRFHSEAKKVFFRLHLEAWGIVVSEVIISSLPKIGMGNGRHRQHVSVLFPCFRLTDPFEFVEVVHHGSLPLYFNYIPQIQFLGKQG